MSTAQHRNLYKRLTSCVLLCSPGGVRSYKPSFKAPSTDLNNQALCLAAALLYQRCIYYIYFSLPLTDLQHLLYPRHCWLQQDHLLGCLPESKTMSGLQGTYCAFNLVQMEETDWVRHHRQTGWILLLFIFGHVTFLFMASSHMVYVACCFNLTHWLAHCSLTPAFTKCWTRSCLNLFLKLL